MKTENTEPSNSTKPVLNDGFKIEVGQIFEIVTDDFYASKNIKAIANEYFGVCPNNASTK